MPSSDPQTYDFSTLGFTCSEPILHCPAINHAGSFHSDKNQGHRVQPQVVVHLESKTPGVSKSFPSRHPATYPTEYMSTGLGVGKPISGSSLG